VLFDSHQRRQIVDRCWLVYELISDRFVPPDEFHSQYPSLVELALTSGYLKLVAELRGSGHRIHISEEYGFVEYKLVLKTYVYMLLDRDQNSLIRADCLPHHKIDYKGHKLSHFPNHLHDEMGRICSFSGRIHDFVKRCSTALE
jgi:hypothetical protein